MIVLVVAPACVDLSPPWGAASATGGRGGSWIPSSSVGPAIDAGGLDDIGRVTDSVGGAGVGGVIGTGGAGAPVGSGGVESDADVAVGSGGRSFDAGALQRLDLGGGGKGAALDGIVASGAGGTQASGGLAASGGMPGAGGVVGTGGKAATGGALGSGGATASCGTAKSTFSETFAFNTNVSPLAIAWTMPSSATTLTYSTTGPSSNPTLCSKGCAVLSIPFAVNVLAYGATAVHQIFSTPVNLVGATVSFSFAIDNPSKVPLQVQVYATGDAASNWSWAAPTTVSGAGLATYSAATGFAAEVLSPIDDPDGYCASSTTSVGLQVQNTTAITSATAGTVTVYIASLAISVP